MFSFCPLPSFYHCSGDFTSQGQGLAFVLVEFHDVLVSSFPQLFYYSHNDSATLHEYLLVSGIINLTMPFCYTWLNTNTLWNEELCFYNGSKSFWLYWTYISGPVLKRYSSFVLQHPYSWPLEPGGFNSFNSIMHSNLSQIFLLWLVPHGMACHSVQDE